MDFTLFGNKPSGMCAGLKLNSSNNHVTILVPKLLQCLIFSYQFSLYKF